MDPTDEKKKEFAAKIPVLTKVIKDWYDEEAASIDGTVAGGAPAGAGGSLIGTTPVIGSKRVTDLLVIAKKILDVRLPTEIIKPGGYDSFDQMVDDLLPKMEKIFIAGPKVRKTKHTDQPETV